jgi:hypothetical protein
LDDQSAKTKTADKTSRKVNDLKETTIEKIIELAARNNGFIRTRDLLVERISKTHLATMVKLGHLERVKQGLYRLADLETVVYRAPQRPSDAAMCGFSRRISQSGKSPHHNRHHLFHRFQRASLLWSSPQKNVQRK